MNGGIDIGPACPVSRGCESHQILAPRGGFGVVAWSVLKNEDISYFPHPGFSLTISMTEFFSGNHFFSGLPYNLLVVWMSVARFRLALLFLGFGVAFDVWLGEPIEVYR